MVFQSLVPLEIIIPFRVGVDFSFIHILKTSDNFGSGLLVVRFQKTYFIQENCDTLVLSRLIN